ncbi:hypothetical protein ADUPG1_010308 [Aduncisulcus paluster]|uniref:Uncharacterized protein n=1 Tax=Aduncisulcus paluster TaxID=2918883 RepID=A0ABQ5JRL4_9EUKA|nr:hypothetical protein ADUPG1_010308 [Aduncisulcus paluster]
MCFVGSTQQAKAKREQSRKETQRRRERRKRLAEKQERIKAGLETEDSEDSIPVPSRVPPPPSISTPSYQFKGMVEPVLGYDIWPHAPTSLETTPSRIVLCTHSEIRLADARDLSSKGIKTHRSLALSGPRQDPKQVIFLSRDILAAIIGGGKMIVIIQITKDVSFKILKEYAAPIGAIYLKLSGVAPLRKERTKEEINDAIVADALASSIPSSSISPDELFPGSTTTFLSSTSPLALSSVCVAVVMSNDSIEVFHVSTRTNNDLSEHSVSGSKVQNLSGNCGSCLSLSCGDYSQLVMCTEKELKKDTIIVDGQEKKVRHETKEQRKDRLKREKKLRKEEEAAKLKEAEEQARRAERATETESAVAEKKASLSKAPPRDTTFPLNISKVCSCDGKIRNMCVISELVGEKEIEKPGKHDRKKDASKKEKEEEEISAKSSEKKHKTKIVPVYKYTRTVLIEKRNCITIFEIADEKDIDSDSIDNPLIFRASVPLPEPFEPQSVSLSPNGKYLAIDKTNCTVDIVNVDDCKVVLRIERPFGPGIGLRSPQWLADSSAIGIRGLNQKRISFFKIEDK